MVSQKILKGPLKEIKKATTLPPNKITLKTTIKNALDIFFLSSSILEYPLWSFHPQNLKNILNLCVYKNLLQLSMFFNKNLVKQF